MTIVKQLKSMVIALAFLAGAAVRGPRAFAYAPDYVDLSYQQWDYWAENGDYWLCYDYVDGQFDIGGGDSSAGHGYYCSTIWGYDASLASFVPDTYCTSW